MKIRNVTVIGANGTLGRLISAIFASFGGTENVYMIVRNKNNVDIKEVAKTVKAISIEKRLKVRRL